MNVIIGPRIPIGMNKFSFRNCNIDLLYQIINPHLLVEIKIKLYYMIILQHNIQTVVQVGNGIILGLCLRWVLTE